MSYIEREAVLTEIKALKDEWGITFTAEGIGFAMEKVQEAPAADVVEVRHGEWQIVDSDIGYVEMRCSLCGCEHLFNTKQGYPYCPSCGAKMDCERREE